MDAEAPLWDADLPERLTFVLGAEREGLPPEIAAACDLRASIPLAGAAESLNVAMAGTVALYEHRRRAPVATRPRRHHRRRRHRRRPRSRRLRRPSRSTVARERCRSRR